MSNSTQGKQTAVVMGKNPDGENTFLQATAAGELKTELPTGAATADLQAQKLVVLEDIDAQTAAAAANQAAGLVVLGSIDTKVATDATLSEFSAKFPSFSFDAGARQRVSQVTTLADLKVLNSDDTLLMESTGTGTGTFGNNKYAMSVTSGQYYIKRSRRYYPYFSGKSQLIECTFDGFQPEANVTKRVGYFSTNAVSPYDSNKDGFWLESAGGAVTLKCSRNGTETLSVAQTSFNGDALSGHDWSGFNVIAFDYLWLGGFQIRLFVKTSAGFVLAHTFAYAGTGAADTFTLSPNHCIRYEIRSTTGSGSFRYICSQVSTEGSFDEAGKIIAIDTGATAITLATVGTTYPILGIRKAAGFRDTPIQFWNFNAFVNSNDQLLITVQINPTLSTTPAFAAITGTSAVQAARGTGAQTVTTSGTKIYSIPLSQNSVIPANLLDSDFLSWLGSTIGDVSDQIWLCGTPISATVSAFGAVMIKQY